MKQTSHIRTYEACTHALRASFGRVASPDGERVPERGKSLYRIRL